MQPVRPVRTAECAVSLCILVKAVVKNSRICKLRRSAVHFQQKGRAMVRPIDGQGFAFVPRTLVAQPKAFGQVLGLLGPAHDVAETGERYRAAMVQHLMAAAVRGELLATEGISPSAFAGRFASRGMGADRIRRIFRGETMAQLTDLVFWSTQFPAVGAVLVEHTSGWTLAESSEEEVLEGSPSMDVKPTSPATPVLGEHLRAQTFREQLEAQRREPAAPGLRHTPQNPYSSTPRRIR